MIVSRASALARMVSAKSRCSGRVAVKQEAGHTDDAVHGRPDLVAHVGEELAFGAVAASAAAWRYSAACSVTFAFAQFPPSVASVRASTRCSSSSLATRNDS